MDIKEIERVVVGLQNRLFKNTSSSSVGIFKSQAKGSGLQFKEHQIYTHGDDVRFIDWRQSAKSQRTYVKTFEEERNVEVHVVADITQSLLLGYEDKTKLQAIVELTALIFLLTGKTQDLTTLHLWTSKNQLIPKSNGKQGIVKLLSLLTRQGILKEDGKINRSYSFEQEQTEENKIFWIKSMLARRKEVLLFTDFSSMELTDEWACLLKNPLFNVFQVLSPIEVMDKKTRLFYAQGDKTSGLGELKTSHKSEWQENKRVKKLQVDEKYLDKFVRDMVRL